MILRLGNNIKLSKEGFNNEHKPFRLAEMSKIDFNKEYKISELYLGDEIAIVDTDNDFDFIFWVEGVNMELGEEHLLQN